MLANLGDKIVGVAYDVPLLLVRMGESTCVELLAMWSGHQSHLTTVSDR